MKLHADDVIVAQASPPDGAVRGIVRLSGPAVADCLGWLRTESPLHEVKRPRILKVQCPLPAPLSAVEADLYYWPGKMSYTRQPAAELHTIGSPPILSAIIDQCCRHGARLAEPGEFTLRSFLAGRIDLTQAEGVLGTIDAASQRELSIALAQLAGGLAQPLAEIRGNLLNLLADLEAGLDFVDEDISFIAPTEARRLLAEAAAEVKNLLQQMETRGNVSRLPTVALAGRPNVGKSSLLNALCQSEAAIVSEIAGTTRDYVQIELQLGDVSCRVIDTAGVVDQPEDEIATAAQRQAEQQANSADLCVLCLDASRAPDAWEAEKLASSLADAKTPGPDWLVAVTKADLPVRWPGFSGENTSVPASPKSGDFGYVFTSSASGAGITELAEAIAGRLKEAGSSEASVVRGTASRCRESLQQAAAALDSARELAESEQGDEIIAAEIRRALDELGQVAGAVYTDDLLDRVFSRFCIGK